MVSKTTVVTIYHCSLERAFKTAMLCDLSKIHTGFIFTPKVTHCTEDQNWGKVGFEKKVHTAPSLINKGGFSFSDRVVDRKENQQWKIEVFNFQTWNFGFSKFEGAWKTTELEPKKILIEYSYALHSNSVFFYPMHWLVTKTFFRIYMTRVLGNIRKMIKAQEPYLYE